MYNWDGFGDLDRFLSLAAARGLLVLLRPGPYICAEWAGGGLPAYLADPAIVGERQPRLRSSDPAFLERVDAWWDVLLPRVARHAVARGGPVAAVQIENEFGFVGGDGAYLAHLAARARALLGGSVVLFTTDPPPRVPGGALPGGDVLTTVDFGPGWYDLDVAFGAARAVNAEGRRAGEKRERGWGEGEG